MRVLTLVLIGFWGKQKDLTSYCQKCQRDEEIDAPVHAGS